MVWASEVGQTSEGNRMTKLLALLFAAALVLGLGSAPTLTYAAHHEAAEEGTNEGAEAAETDESAMPAAEKASDDDTDSDDTDTDDTEEDE